MAKLQDEINRWKQEYAKPNCNTDDYKLLLVDMHHIDESEDVSIIERIVLLLNQCAVIDKIGDDNIEIEGVDYSRNSILEQIQVYYEEYVSSSLIDEFDCDASIAFKEQIAYLIALLLYKVHRYQDSLVYFKESRNYSKRLSNTENPNGLNLKRRIQRDIYYAYSCEYIGTPQSDKWYLVKAIQLLIGTSEISDPDEYWNLFKDYCFEKLYGAGFWLKELDKEKTTCEILKCFTCFSPDDHCVLSRLLKDQSLYNVEYSKEYKEAIHVLAHCLNEVNALKSWTADEHTTSIAELEKQKITNNEAYTILSKRNFIKFISRVLIDSLGEKYATCQATIRAEQGIGVDAVSILNKLDKKSLKEPDLAELDFYQFYFNTMFFYNLDVVGNNTNYGDSFYKYCENTADIDNRRDGLLHYHIVSLRNDLRQYIDKIMNAKDRNSLFLLEENAIGKSPCFHHYEFLRKNEFTIYENSQIVHERERLIYVYRVIRTLQNLKLPLYFDATAKFDEKLDIKDAIEELFELCHKANYYFDSIEQSIPYQYSKHFGCKGQTNCVCCSKNAKDVVAETNAIAETASEECEIDDKRKITYSTLLLDNTLKFDVYGKLDDFTNFLSSKKVDFKIIQKDKNPYTLNQSKHIIVFDSDWSEICLELYQLLVGSIFHIFYVYSDDGEEPDFENFNSAPIAAFPSMDLCFLFAFIYASVDKIINGILNPKPIFILAPLRNASSYEFQDAEFSSLVDCPYSVDSKVIISRGGIGIDDGSKKTNTSERQFNLIFANSDVKRACVDVLKFVDDRLYVLRDGVLVQKNRVYATLIIQYFLEYSKARKRVVPKIHSKCEVSDTKCCCVCCEINDEIGDNTLSIKKLNAGEKLLRFLRLACEEDIAWSTKLYLLEKSYITIDPATEYNCTKKLEFELYLFDKDIKPFVGDKCLKNMVTVTEVFNKDLTPSSDSPDKSSVDLSESDDIDGWRSDIQKLKRRMKMALNEAQEDGTREKISTYLECASKLEAELNNPKKLTSWIAKFTKLNDDVEEYLRCSQ